MKIPGSDPDTVVAIATPPGRGAISVIRASGPGVRKLINKVLAWPDENQPPPRRTRLAGALDDRGEVVDQVLWVFYPGPHSYTGEDVVEISSHGSPVVTAEIVKSCVAAGARVAQPGEFTMRAFLKGKMDLVQAEAVGDLIASQTRYQADVAREQLEGRLSKSVSPVREQLIEAVSHLETRLEFVEDDVDPGSRGEIGRALDEARRSLAELSDSFSAGQLLREGLTVVIAGRPNVGKSSIFNTLLRSERAIVTEIPGTTRDSLREWIDLGGIPVCLVDTAGIRTSGDHLEMLGVDRSVQEVKESDLILFVVNMSEGFVEEDRAVWRALTGHPYLVVLNKADLGEAAPVPEEIARHSRGSVQVSARTGANLGNLAERIRDFTGAPEASDRGRTLVTNLRQKACLDEAAGELEQAIQALDRGLSEEFVSYDVRRALIALEELMGETTTGEILDRIFSTFCIGK